MTMHSVIRRVALAIGTMGTLVAMGCHGILDVSDPTLIRDADIENSNGANSMRLNASSTFVGSIRTTIPDVAYITDEWTRDVPSGSVVTSDVAVQLDQRNSSNIELLLDYLNPLANAFWQTSVAIPAVRAYTPDSLKGDFLGQLYGIRGYLVLQMAEDLCPGFPINDVVDSRTVYGGPVTTDSAVAYASNQLDSAVKYALDSGRFVTLARVVKGRALLDQGKYDDAAAMVASVPTDSVYASEQTYRVAMATTYNANARVTAVGDREGTNGLPFESAHDVRVPLQRLGVRRTRPSDTMYITTKGRSASDVIVLASGIEARLIQAEAALHNNQNWKSILDSLRATVGLDSLVDPGTDPARVDMIYSERGFWLYMTGRRLGDMRRLIHLYGRDPERVFPTGSWIGGTGDQYGTATSIPFQFSDQHRYNPNITTGCTSR